MKNLTVTLILTLLVFGCHDQWLDVKPDKTTVVPKTLKDLQGLLDNEWNMNSSVTPTLGVFGTDDFYLTSEEWQSLSTIQQQNGYRWARDVYENSTTDVYSWNNPYRQAFYSNLALEGLQEINPTASQQEKWNNIKGSALFYRAFAFYQLAQEFCKPYNSATAESDLGIPLRLESNINTTSVRSTVQQTYDQILEDLTTALPLLPDVPLIQTRPSKLAVRTLLARTYLQMGLYDKALDEAEAALEIKDLLIDYNTLDPTASFPFSVLNEEVIFHSTIASPFLYLTDIHVDSVLYDSYGSNDLRRLLYFFDNSGITAFKGSYYGNLIAFTGLATDELYLMQAECLARDGNAAAAMDALNDLLETRWEAGTFTPFTAADSEEALTTILEERRKELVFRGVRWSDLRRLNKDPRFAKTLTRNLDGTVYELPPNDPRYVLPIPPDVIDMTGMEQNPR